MTPGYRWAEILRQYPEARFTRDEYGVCGYLRETDDVMRETDEDRLADRLAARERYGSDAPGL